MRTPAGRGGLNFLNPFLYAIDDIESVLTVPHYDDPADDLALSIEFADTIPKVRSQMDLAYILQIDWNAVFNLKNDVLQITDTSYVAASADEKLSRRNFEGPASRIHVALADGIDDIADGNR